MPASKRKEITPLLLVLLLVTSLSAGCTADSLNQGFKSIADLLRDDNDKANRSSLNPYSPTAVNEVLALQQFSLTPSKVLEGKTTTVTASISNKGKEDVVLHLGKNGRSLLKNYCRDLFSLESYSSTLKSQTRGVKEVNSKQVTLKPAEKLEANWILRAGQVPKIYSCQLELERSYEYSVSNHKQVQIKQSESIESAQINNDKSQRGFVQVKLETGSSSYLAGETIYLHVLLENKGQGTADIKEITVNYPQLSGSCQLPNAESLILSPGAKHKFRCVISKQQLEVPSQMYRISASARYKYDLQSEKSLEIIK